MALEGKPVSNSLIEKSCSLAGIILEMAGAAERGAGRRIAEETLRSGKALAKLREIIKAQGGNPDVTSDDIKVGQFKIDIFAPEDGYVERIDNGAVIQICRTVGAPKNKGAGMIFHKKQGNQVKKGEALYTIYADNEKKLEWAKAMAQKLAPVSLGGMVLGRVPEYTKL